jgi:hypothetical protein
VSWCVRETKTSQAGLKFETTRSVLDFVSPQIQSYLLRPKTAQSKPTKMADETETNVITNGEKEETTADDAQDSPETEEKGETVING